MTDMGMLFDRLAHRYDQVIPFFAEFATQLLDLVEAAPGTRLLDIGSGRGAIAVAVATRGCAVTAVDAAPRMVSLPAELTNMQRSGGIIVDHGAVVHLATAPADDSQAKPQQTRQLPPSGITR
jgi:precorrin-6B methylase 2